MANVQPLLTPCKGAAADLVLCLDPKRPDRLNLFWGTAVLQVIPRDRDSLLARITAALLAGLGLKLETLAAHFGTTPKTLREWLKALLNGDWEELARLFDGPGAPKSLSGDIERYVRVRYVEALAENGGDMPYGFRQTLLKELTRYWGVAVCGEVLRRVFRDEDERRAARVADDAHCRETLEGADSSSVDDRPGAPEESPVDVADGEPAPVAKGPAPVESRHNGEERCAFEPGSGTDSEKTRNIPTDSDGTVYGGGDCSTVPLFADDFGCGPAMSQHAGLLLLSPWFEDAFGDAPPIVRQTAAQILLGAVNQEQSKQIDFNGLQLMIDRPNRDIDSQHALLGDLLDDRAPMEVFAANARVLHLSGQRIFYVDTHHKRYTGLYRVLPGWSGSLHSMLKGIMMDFIHTEDGEPCFIGHYDNYYDARDRFVLLTDRFRTLFPEDAENFLWINDRGYWAQTFLERIAENGDRFIQWEKGYKDDGWSAPHCRSGKVTIVRKRNNRSDAIKIRVRWREQNWDRFPGARRLIARIHRPAAKPFEVSIVTNDSSLDAGRIIRLMLNRWVQENDFTYLIRHFGIHELGGRTVESYGRIADQLEDRQVESREHKQAQVRRGGLRDELGSTLVKLQGMPEISLQKLDKQRQRLRNEKDAVSAELQRLALDNTPAADARRVLDRLGRNVSKLLEKIRLHQQAKPTADKRAEAEATAARLRNELQQIEAHIREMNRTESRLLALIEERYVRHDLRKKALLDAIRITCRNVFRQTFDIMRPIYNDYRDDHVIMRELTRSSGVVIKHQDRIDIYLTPKLHRQAAQWTRIKQFIDICGHRIRQRFGITIRVMHDRTDRQIFAAIARCSSPT